MKKFSKIILSIAIAIFAFPNLQAEHLIVIGANDTHSQIEPDGNLGGIYRRRAAMDQIRRENKHVIAVHAGDAVQGTLYFSMFKGEVEYGWWHYHPHWGSYILLFCIFAVFVLSIMVAKDGTKVIALRVKKLKYKILKIKTRCTISKVRAVAISKFILTSV
jgi:hypothetical protein